jgi:hypothetical protein
MTFQPSSALRSVPPPLIDFDADPLINPEVANLLRDFIPEWTAYAQMRAPAWQSDELIMRATELLLYSFYFFDYLECTPGAYQDEIEVSLLV